MMRLGRRQLLTFAAGIALLAGTFDVMAQSYPTRPVRWVVPYAPGGPNDILARLMSPWLAERLGQQFIIENRAGAAGNVATEAVVRAPADGYTLLSVSTPHAINETLYDKLNFNVIRDIAPVVGFIRTPLVLLVHPSVPSKTVPEFIAYAKANPGKINMASAGNGTPQHVSGELFKMMTGTDMTHVPYRGSAPALTDLIAGQVQFMFDTTPASMQYIKSGTLRPLAVTTLTRVEALPDIPCLSDFLKGYEASAWYGLGTAKNTAPAIIAKLNMEMNAALADQRVGARLADLGGSSLGGSPDDFAKLIVDEIEKWAKVVKFSGAKPD